MVEKYLSLELLESLEFQGFEVLNSNGEPYGVRLNWDLRGVGDACEPTLKPNFTNGT